MQDLPNELAPQWIVNQPRVWVLARDVGHRGPEIRAMHAVLEDFPCIIDRLRQDDSVDDDVEPQPLTASVLIGQIQISLDTVCGAAGAGIDQCVASPFLDRIEADNEVVEMCKQV